MSRALGIITAASNRFKIEGLQEHRPVGAFTFAGRYRLIDFPISNLSNSGIDRISVCISGNPRSLVEHIGSGRNYNINSKRGQLQQLFHDEGNINPIYNTDIAFFMEHLAIIERQPQEYVVICPSNMVFVQNYHEALEKHIASEADITLLYHKVDDADVKYLGCNYLSLNRQKGVQSITTNEGTEKSRNLFMDSYIMKKNLFVELVRKAAKISSVYHLSQIVNDSCEDLDVRGIQHKGYFAAITDFKSYFDFNLNLTDISQAKTLLNNDWPIYTKTSDACPTRYYEGANVKNSLVSNGCKIKGTVENSVIGRGVTIGEGAVIKNSVILAYSNIAPGVKIENQVVDKWVQIKNVREVCADASNPGYVRRDDIL